MKRLTYTKTALKDLKGIPKADSEAIRSKLQKFANDEPQDLTPIKGTNLHRLRHGNWRALLEIETDTITVATVLHRREAYR